MADAAEVGEERMRHLVGAADVCELLAAAFQFPADGALAQALADGRFAADARGSLIDAGAPPEVVVESDALLAPFEGRDPDALQQTLRRGHSLLFLAPGAKVPVWPYEAPFLFREKGRSGLPSLFRSPTTLAAASAMAEAGFPVPDGSEPPDSAWNELRFVSFLLTDAASALQSGDEGRRRCANEGVRRFWGAHAGRWLPSFMEQVQREAAVREAAADFGPLARWGALALSALPFSIDDGEGARV